MANQLYRKDGEQLLNSWLVGILWIKIVFTTLSVVENIWKMFMEADYNTPLVVANVMLAIFAIIGGYWLLHAEKRGFYLIVGTNIALAILSYYQYTQITFEEYGMYLNMAQQSALRGVWGGLGQILFIMLLMLLKKDGKNAYHVLWTNE